MKKINPKNLFSKDINNYKIYTNKLGKVKYVNLDNAATTPPFKKVEDAICNYLESYGSVHRGAGIKSQISTDIYEQSRDIIKDFVNAPKDDYVIFNQNTTGAINNLAYFFSFLKGKIAVSEIEHSSSWLPWVKSEGERIINKKQSYIKQINKINNEIQKIGNKQVIKYGIGNNYDFDLKSIEKIFKRNKIKAFVLTASSNITGYCPDIKKIGKIVHKYNAYFVVDGCQHIQHHPINMRGWGIDFLVASGHKFYAPYGGGILIGPKKFFDNFLPYQIGGGNLPYIDKNNNFIRYKNQLAHDPGTPNAVGAVAMAKALKELKALGVNNIEKYEKDLTLWTYKNIKKIPNIKLYVQEEKLSTIITFEIAGQDPSITAKKLNDNYGIGIRAGSFCVYNVVRKLKNIKDDSLIVKEVKKGNTTIIPQVARASFSLCNNYSDAKRFVQAIKEIAYEK